jgi:hypothetical protein
LAGQPQQGQTKKLIEAAEYWASGGRDNGEHLDDDAKAFGVVVEQPEPEHFEVWPENWDAVLMFTRLQTQWRASAGGVIGLDYGAVGWLLRLYEVKDQRALLEDLQIMEGAALAVIHREG